jgi:hypothetical protein
MYVVHDNRGKAFESYWFCFLFQNQPLIDDHFSQFTFAASSSVARSSLRRKRNKPRRRYVARFARFSLRLELFLSKSLSFVGPTAN